MAARRRPWPVRRALPDQRRLAIVRIWRGGGGRPEVVVFVLGFAGGLRFERSNEYAFGNDQVAFRTLVRTGAVTVDPNAVKYFANSAT